MGQCLPFGYLAVNVILLHELLLYCSHRFEMIVDLHGMLNAFPQEILSFVHRVTKFPAEDAATPLNTMGQVFRRISVQLGGVC